MPNSARSFLAMGAMFSALAVAFGAIGTHALASRVPADRLAIWQTAVQYHIYHALGLFVVGFVCQIMPNSMKTRIAGYAIVAGILLFSGSLYAYALYGEKWLTTFAPIGGLSLIAGWILLAIALLLGR